MENEYDEGERMFSFYLSFSFFFCLPSFLKREKQNPRGDGREQPGTRVQPVNTVRFGRLP